MSSREKGVIFVESLKEIPNSSHVIFSAHGVSKAIVKESNKFNLISIDATCPLVTKVHMEVAKFEKQGKECVLIGHVGHPEVEGTMGQYTSDEGGIYLVETPEDVARLRVKNPNNLAFVTQTTLSVDDTSIVIDALKQHFPAIEGPRKDDICYATQNRQNAVKSMAKECDILMVVGSKNSSNSNRLRELSEKLATPDPYR